MAILDPNSKPLVINGVKWSPAPGVNYKYNLYKILDRIKGGEDELGWYATLVLNDLWFLVTFVLKVPLEISNTQFWVDNCRMVVEGPSTKTLDLWFRFGGKSTVLTVGDTIRRILWSREEERGDAKVEERVAILSYAQEPALKPLRGIRLAFEESDLLKDCFPNVLFKNPQKEAFKWGDETGLFLKREGFHREPCVSAYGLIQGMPTGSHFTGRVYDDIMTQDLANSPDVIQDVCEKFDLSSFLRTGTSADWERVIGTPYHHEDVLNYIRQKKDSSGNPIYHLRTRPATVDGSLNGPSVYLPEQMLSQMREENLQAFYSQMLLDPTPRGEQKLMYQNIADKPQNELPSRLFRFMAIDPAGFRKDRTGDSWAILVVGVEPYRDDLGRSNIYILDGLIETMEDADALSQIPRIFERNGRILKLGVEKVGMSSAEIHVANALRAKGKYLSVENGRLEILRPQGRKKEERIMQNLQLPLQDGRIFFAESCPLGVKQRLKKEMEKFPYWKDDGIDALAYIYDMIKNYRFGPKTVEEELEGMKLKKPWTREDLEGETGWMIQ